LQISKQVLYLHSDKQLSISVNFFFMVSFPVLITRSVLVLDSKKSKQLVSVTFIAKFSDGSEKFLNDKGWEPIGLLKTSFLGEHVLPKNECCLYYKDWSKNPTYGTFRDK
jgi:hypothetical protein